MDYSTALTNNDTLYINPYVESAVEQHQTTKDSGSFYEQIRQFISDGFQSNCLAITLETKDSLREQCNTTEELQNIKKSLGLNLSQLAQIIGVSRPQLYKWLDGDLPKSSDSNKRIKTFNNALSSIPAADASYFGRLANRYINKDETLLDALAKADLSDTKFLSIYQLIKTDISSLKNKLA